MGQFTRALQLICERGRHHLLEPMPRPTDLSYAYAAARYYMQVEATRSRNDPPFVIGNAHQVPDVEAMFNNESGRMEEVD